MKSYQLRISAGLSILACALQIAYLLGGVWLGLKSGDPGAVSIVAFFAGFFILLGLQFWLYRPVIRRRELARQAREAEANKQQREAAESKKRERIAVLKAKHGPEFHHLIDTLHWGDTDGVERHIARVHEMERDPAARKYLVKQMNGQWVSDLEVRYWDNPGMLVSCEHLRVVEAKLRAEDSNIRIGEKTLRTSVSNERLIEMAADAPPCVRQLIPAHPHASREGGHVPGMYSVPVGNPPWSGISQESRLARERARKSRPFPPITIEQRSFKG